ncbi:MAG: LysM peptidoglycan-binding domain-containing protein [Dehalococcoidia bacterium]
MRLRRRAWSVALGALAIASIAGAACGGEGSDAGEPPDLSKVATATLPAELPEPILIGLGNVSTTGGPTYTVQSGDTLAGIAARFNLSLDDLRAANPVLDPAQLSVGDVVRLPEGTEPAAPTETPAASEEQTPTEAPPPVEEPTSTPEPPAPTPTPSSIGQTYVVQSGDIPETIAAQFGITTAQLLAANPGVNPNSLQVGQVLIIPPAAAPEGG